MGELVIKIHVSPQVWQSTAMKHIFAMVDMQTSFVALGPWFALVVITQGQGFGSRGSRSGQILHCFFYYRRGC